MPSGAKKRKAAKKKLQKEAHHFTKSNGTLSHNQGSNDPKCNDERNSDVEREGNVEGVDVNNHDVESAKELNLSEGNVAEKLKQQERSLESFQDDVVHTDDAATGFSNVTSKSSSSTSSRSGSSSSSSSSSGDDEVVVEKEKPAETELGEVEPQVENFESFSAEVATPAECVNDVENPADESVEESIPTEELVEHVVSLPQESIVVSDSVPVDNWSTSDATASELKQNDHVLQPFDEKFEVASGVTTLLQEKIEEKVIPDTSEPVDVNVTAKNDEGLLPQSSGVKAVEGCCVDDDGKVPETLKYTEEQPLISSTPMPVRRTSWMNCCGLFEVFSGQSS